MVDTQGTLAVVSQTGESLNFFDVASGERICTIQSVTSEPHELCYDAKRNVIYMSHAYRHGNYWDHGEDSHEISIIDAATKEIVEIVDTMPAKGPHGLYIDHNRDILYISVEVLPDRNGGGLIGIDLNTKKVIKTIASGYRSHWFAMTPDGRKAYTCNKTASFISVLDLERETMIGKIDVRSCEEPSMSLDGRYAYFPTPGFAPPGNAIDPAIEVIDTATDTIVKSIKMSYGGIPVHVAPSGCILVGQYSFGGKFHGLNSPLGFAQLAIYDGETHSVLGEIPIGKWPLTIRCSPDGHLAFVANILEGTVSVIDLEAKKAIRTIKVDSKPRQDKKGHVGAHGLAFIPHQ